jgi:hypothetical protein
VGASDFSLVELLEINRACGSLRLSQCSAGYFGDYVATHLAGRRPRLAVKVHALPEEQLEVLCERVRGVRASVGTSEPQEMARATA